MCEFKQKKIHCYYSVACRILGEARGPGSRLSCEEQFSEPHRTRPPRNLWVRSPWDSSSCKGRTASAGSCVFRTAAIFFDILKSRIRVRDLTTDASERNKCPLLVFARKAEKQKKRYSSSWGSFLLLESHTGVRAWGELSFTVGVLDGKASGKCLTWPSTYAGEIVKQSCGKWGRIKGGLQRFLKFSQIVQMSAPVAVGKLCRYNAIFRATTQKAMQWDTPDNTINKSK